MSEFLDFISLKVSFCIKKETSLWFIIWCILNNSNLLAKTCGISKGTMLKSLDQSWLAFYAFPLPFCVLPTHLHPYCILHKHHHCSEQRDGVLLSSFEVWPLDLHWDFHLYLTGLSSRKKKKYYDASFMRKSKWAVGSYMIKYLRVSTYVQISCKNLLKEQQ